MPSSIFSGEGVESIGSLRPYLYTDGAFHLCFPIDLDLGVWIVIAYSWP